MRYSHIMLRVFDLKKSLDFYKEILGFEVVSQLQGDDCNIYFLGNNESGNVQIEILDEFVKPDKYNNGNSIGHIAFDTDNMDDVGRKLEKMGYCWSEKPFYMEKVNSMLGFLKDPDGNEIELLQKCEAI